MNTLELSLPGDGTAVVRLNRPEKRNALSPQMLRELQYTFEQLAADERVQVIIVEGAGTAFSAGADLEYLQEISANSTLENMEDSLLLERTFYTIYTTPKATIAKVHGPALAGGCGLATVCDFIVASRERAVFGYTEVRIGFIPAVVGIYLLRKVGDAVARRLLLSGERISAEEAHRVGLVSHLADHEKLNETVHQLVAMLRANSASSIALTKRMLAAAHGMSLDSALQYAAALNVIARGTPDCRERVAEFLHKSKGSA
ncbi:MAG: enoyl-CoA hydratase-related protein [Bacteroidota bacterium]|nr:enoyl-CoA hydratase-related protein [Bacteroidota bacterium]